LIRTEPPSAPVAAELQIPSIVPVD
jgi:hypothetical protein